MCTICNALRGNDSVWLLEANARHNSVGSSSGTQNYSVAKIASYLNEDYWGGPSGSRHFDVEAGGTLTVNVSALASAGRTLARKALDAWSDATGITFVERSGRNVDIAFDDEASGAYASQTLSNGFITSAFVNVNKSWAGGDPEIDSYHFQTYLHEIGHALGLGHAGRYNGSADYGKDNAYANDSWQMSVMSYFSQAENPMVDASFGFTITPMIADILAVQELYGTARTRTGDTVYGEGGNTGTSIDEWLELDGNVALTIWDGGGTDLINLSGESYDQVLDLRASGISDVQGLRGNLLIAKGTVIENAATGDGDDVVIGNGASNSISLGGGADIANGGGRGDRIDGGTGNDRLNGGNGRDRLDGGDGNDVLNGSKHNDTLNGQMGDDRLLGGQHADTLIGGDGDDVLIGGRDADDLQGGDGADRLLGGGGRDKLDGGFGADVLYGGGGADVFIFADGCGADEIADFSSKAAEEFINLSGASEIDGWDDLRDNHLSAGGGNCIIDLGNGDSVTLIGVGIGSLSADEFLF